MKIIFSIILALAASAAFATGNNNGPTCVGNGACTTNNTTNNSTTNAPKAEADAKATAIATQGQSQGQQQGQAQGQLQGQAQGQIAKGGNATNAGNSQSTNITFNEQKQAVAAFAPAMNATASCRVGVGVGVGAAVGGISLGGSYRDDVCDKREKGRMLIESARIAQSLGAPQEFYAPLFSEGLALIRGSDESPKAAETAQPVSYVQ